MAKGESISYVQTSDGVLHPFDAKTLNGKSGFELKDNLVDHIDTNSTTDQYPSAKCMYDIIGDLSSLLTKDEE